MPFALASSAIDIMLPWISSLRHRAGVAGDVVRAGEDDHRLRLQVDHVRPEPNQHLRRRLAADAAADVRLAGEEVAEARLRPGVGDRVAHEDDARLAGGGCGERAIRVAIAREVRPVPAAARRCPCRRARSPQPLSGQSGAGGCGGCCGRRGRLLAGQRQISSSSGSIRSAALLRMRDDPFSQSPISECGPRRRHGPGRRNPFVAADARARASTTPPPSGSPESCRSGEADPDRRKAQRGSDEGKDDGELLRRRGHPANRTGLPTPQSGEPIEQRTSAATHCQDALGSRNSSRAVSSRMLCGHALHRHPRSDAAAHRHRFVAASALVRHQHVGQAARHLHAGRPLPREVPGCARGRDQRRGARRPRHPHARRLPLRRGFRRPQLAPLSAAALDRLRRRLPAVRGRRAARGCAIRPARCSTRSTPRGAGRA